MPSLRQYASASVIAQIADVTVDKITDKVINQAESMIDSYIAEFYGGNFSKCFNQNITLASSNALFTDTSLTITPNPGNSDNYYSYTVAELLEGSNKGLVIPVISSNGNVLTFDSVFGLSGNIACRIYQLGKFPMVKDYLTHKSIPREIIEALSYQVEFLVVNGKKINKRTKKSESIGENYSYTNADGSEDDITNRIAPMAKDILERCGYTAQTI